MISKVLLAAAGGVAVASAAGPQLRVLRTPTTFGTFFVSSTRLFTLDLVGLKHGLVSGVKYSKDPTTGVCELLTSGPVQMHRTALRKNATLVERRALRHEVQ